MLVKSYFTIDDEKFFEGYHNPEQDWNGFQCPWFAKPVAMELAKHFNLKVIHNLFIELDDENEDATTFDADLCTTENGQQLLWPIGNSYWVWSEATYYQLAVNFCMVLEEWLSKKEIAEIVKRNNKDEDKGICHSHDFCDANQAMIDAFEKLFKREPAIYFYESEEEEKQIAEDTHLMDLAWSLAKKHNFSSKALVP